MEPSHLPCNSLTHPAAILTPSIGVLRWIRANVAAALRHYGWKLYEALTFLGLPTH